MKRKRLSRFRVVEFTNRAGSVSFRVTGTGRDGRRIRENHASLKAAQTRQAELEADFVGRSGGEEKVRFTSLTEKQTRIAEGLFLRADEDEDLVRALDYWLAQGRPKVGGEVVRLDDAMEAFTAWLDNAKNPLRPRTKANLRTRLSVFGNGLGNVPVRSVDADALDAWLDKRGTSPRNRKNDLLAVSRFFSWCADRPRRWVEVNPARLVRIAKGSLRPGTPEVLTPREILRLLAAAKRYRGGLLAPYVALALFGAVRPNGELARLRWDQLNFQDGQLTIASEQEKTHRARTIALEGPLRSWLEWAAKRDQKIIHPPDFWPNFRALRQKAKLTRWPADVLRHTGVSYYFRKTGSYGLTAEWAGNSEAIIKARYQGRVTTAEAAAFWILHPERAQRGKARSG